jgi:hypothetical protein
MKISARTVSASIVAIFFASAAYASPPTVNPEPMDLDVATNATIMKEKSKRRNMEQPGGGNSAGGSSDSGCGQVNINNNDKKSNSGIKDMFGKQQTTVITGPVINMANCK